MGAQQDARELIELAEKGKKSRKDLKEKSDKRVKEVITRIRSNDYRYVFSLFENLDKKPVYAIYFYRLLINEIETPIDKTWMVFRKIAEWLNSVWSKLKEIYYEIEAIYVWVKDILVWLYEWLFKPRKLNNREKDIWLKFLSLKENLALTEERFTHGVPLDAIQYRLEAERLEGELVKILSPADGINRRSQHAIQMGNAIKVNTETELKKLLIDELYKEGKTEFQLEHWAEAVAYLQAAQEIDDKYIHNDDIVDLPYILKKAKRKKFGRWAWENGWYWIVEVLFLVLIVTISQNAITEMAFKVLTDIRSLSYGLPIKKVMASVDNSDLVQVFTNGEIDDEGFSPANRECLLTSKESAEILVEPNKPLTVSLVVCDTNNNLYYYTSAILKCDWEPQGKVQVDKNDSCRGQFTMGEKQEIIKALIRGEKLLESPVTLLFRPKRD